MPSTCAGPCSCAELTADDWKRVYVHPENGRMTIQKALDLYAWHTRHHIAHITSLRERSGWH